jgi:Tripartite tricarboxylate transporter TctB family
MRIKANALFSLFLAAVAAYAIAAALSWPFKAALFPLVMGIPLLLLALAQLFLDLRGEAGAADGSAVELQPGADVAPEIARRRTAAIFAWMAAFVVLVLLLGFPLAVPLFVFSYLVVQSAAGWGLSIALTAAAWGFFHGLFERLLHLPFDTGLVQTWLGP